MKKLLFLLAIILSCLLSVLVSRSNLVLAQENEEKLLLFVEEGCPYCQLTEKFIDEKGISENIDIKDVRENAENANLYTSISDEAGIPVNDRGVPMLYDGGETYTSADEIITYLAGKYDLSTEGYIDANDDNETGESVNKNVIFAILGVGIVLSVGYLLLSMKDKK